MALDRKSRISLREITAETVRQICGLQVHEHQRHLVAPNAVSIAQAYFSDLAWMRAVYADDEPVGFVMIEDNPDKAEYFLWRFMIDARFQSLGFGFRAMEQIIEHVRSRPGATEFITSVVDTDGGALPFYRKLGFEPTGEMEENEIVLRLDLATGEQPEAKL